MRKVQFILAAVPVLSLALIAQNAGTTPPFVQRTEALPEDGLPNGPGKPVVGRVCTTCHGPEMYAGQSRTRSTWESTMTTMSDKGMMCTDEEWGVVLEYLTSHFGPNKLDINKASAADIKSYLRMSDAEAEAIVKYRTANGNFKNLGDLKKVQGLDAAKVDGIKDYVGFVG